jgi:hypothetical protein
MVADAASSKATIDVRSGLLDRRKGGSACPGAVLSSPSSACARKKAYDLFALPVGALVSPMVSIAVSALSPPRFKNGLNGRAECGRERLRRENGTINQRGQSITWQRA